MNTNRVRLLDETATGVLETGYCYDAADRILATTGASAVTSINYDSHGNTTGYVAGGAVTTLGWDGADRNIQLEVEEVVRLEVEEAVRLEMEAILAL